MYNTRNSSGDSHDYPCKIEVDTLSPQEQQQTSPETTEMEYEIQQPPEQSIPLHNFLSESSCPNPIAVTRKHTTPDSSSSTVDYHWNKRIKLEHDDQSSFNAIPDIKLPVKRKTSKKEQKKRMNARVQRLISPKNPLVVFSELFKDVPILLQEHQLTSGVHYTATLELDGHVYTGNHASKLQAKQNACESYLRKMLEKNIKERSEKKDKLPMEVNMEDGEISTVSKLKKPPQEEFPWPQFAALAMHNLITRWDIQPASKGSSLNEEPDVIKLPLKSGARRKFPDNPKICNPVQLLHQMKPGLKFTETLISTKPPTIFQINCEIDNIPFTGQGSTKKTAKKECCIAAIKHFWQFDFHAIKD